MLSKLIKKISLVIVSTFLANFTFVTDSNAQSNSWSSTMTNSNVGFIPSAEPNCRTGYCPNSFSGISGQTIANYLSQPNSRVSVSASSNTYYVAALTPSNQYTKYVFFTTNNNTLPVINEYYESEGAGTSNGAVTVYNVTNNGWSMVSCSADNIKTTGFKIISYSANSFVAKYFVNCTKIDTSGNKFTTFTESSNIVFRPVSAVNPLENESFDLRLKLAQSKSQRTLTSQNGIGWFQKYAAKVFP